MSDAIQVLWSEHANIDIVLGILRKRVTDVAEGTWESDFELFLAVLDYMEAFPETFHHPKEEEHLFKALRRRRPEAAPILDKLHEEHADSLDLLANLRHALMAYRGDHSAFPRFQDAVQDYIEHQREHMRQEEDEILPLAQQALTDQDWDEINTAFAQNDDPLLGSRRERQFDGLLAQIVGLRSRSPPVSRRG